jgi:hypothetical protein
MWILGFAVAALLWKVNFGEERHSLTPSMLRAMKRHHLERLLVF